MDYDEIMAYSKKAKEDMLRQIDESDETPANKIALKTLFGNMSPLDFVQIVFPGFQKDTFKETEKYAKMDFKPVYTQRSSIRKLQFEDNGMKTINTSTIHFVWKLRPSFYLNIYFVRAARDYFHACCYYGDIFNHIYGKDVRNTKGGETFPKTMAKRFPYICKILRNTTMHDKVSDPYLNTIAFGGNTSRQWFLCVRINDIKEFADLSMFGPRSELMKNVINDLNQAAAKIMYDVYDSTDTVMKNKFGELVNMIFPEEL